MSVQAPHLRPASPWPQMSGPMGPVAAPAAPVAPAWAPASPVASPAAGAQRVAELEAMVASLSQQLNALMARLGGQAPAAPWQQPVAPAPAAVAPFAPVQRPAWLNQLPAWLRPAAAAPAVPVAPAVPMAPVAPVAPAVPLAADGRLKPLVDVIVDYKKAIEADAIRSSSLEASIFSGILHQGGKVFILPGYLMTHGVQMLSWAYLGRAITAEEKQRYQQWIWDQNGDPNKIQATQSRIMKDIEDRAVFQVLQQKMAAGQPVADLAQEAEAIRKKAADLLYYPK